jgi:asparagine N-glycosylation enzyme membrane subunit Stt3
MSSQGDEAQLAKQRLQTIVHLLKTQSSLWAYGCLVLLMAFAYWLRTRNLPLLRDITTGGWALGPDLDPYLFLRWAEYIVEHGSIMAHDALRYVPLGFDTSRELLLLPYMIAWFHKVHLLFGAESVIHSAVLFPAVMFALTVGVFFFMTHEIFKIKMSKQSSLFIALCASAFLTIIPALLPRTIAGIPEKESIGFLFMFLAFWGFVGAWNALINNKKIIFTLIAIIGTIAMANAWGGFAYIFVTLSIACTIMFLYNQISFENKIMYLSWILLSTGGILLTTNRYSLSGLIISPITGLAYALGVMIVVEYLLKEKIPLKLPYAEKISVQIYSLLIVLGIGIIGAIGLTSIEQVIGQAYNIKNALVSPIVDRFGVTVAENRQPFFTEWIGSFGKLFFFTFIVGSLGLLYSLFNTYESKTRIVKTLAFAYFLIAIIFSRYDPSSMFNGTNSLSLLFYASGFLVLIGVFGYYYLRGEKGKLDFGYVLLLSFFFFSIVSARGSVRTIMVLVPTAAILSWYLCFALYVKSKEGSFSYLRWGAYSLGFLLLYLGFFAGGGGIVEGNFCSGSSSSSFFKESYCTAKSFGPSAYTQQWQQAMSWVRDNTPSDAVFAHWWDYGYWLQSIGKRATVLDGGNSYGYWNHLMGRLVLTGNSSESMFQYLGAHKVTHLLIDSTDIGKYGAYSSIGSGVSYDRRSYIPSLVKQQALSQTKNASLFLYSGGFSLDQDITYNLNGSDIFLPEGSAGVGGIIAGFNANNVLITQPQALIVYKNNQISLPLRYAYQNNTLFDFKTGVEAGIFLYPRLTNENGQIQVQADGAALYISPKVFSSNIAQLYLFNKTIPGFRLVHEQDDAIVASIKSQNKGLLSGPFLHDELYGGIRGGTFAGSIKIWEVIYPSNMLSNNSYLETEFPDKRLNKA